MSNPIEPKFPKRHFNARFKRTVTAPDGCYLLPAAAILVNGDRSWTLGGWGQPEMWLLDRVANELAWTYARKLPDGQLNDDLPVQSASEQAPDDAGLTTAALATQLEFALHAVYENCRQNRNKGIGAGPLAMARSALVAAGVDLKAPLQWEGAPEAEQQFAPTDPRTPARENLQAWGDIARAALERNTADAEQRRKLFHESQVTALIREFVPALIEHRPDLRPVDAARQAAEMARIAMEKAAAFSVETPAPPTDPQSHPGAPVLRMTHDGKVTAFGAIEAPAGCYLLPAGEMLQEGDLCLKDTGVWGAVAIMQYAGNETWVTEQFCYARKLPPAEGRADG